MVVKEGHDSLDGLFGVVSAGLVADYQIRANAQSISG
jgi:hypothetical protein